MKTAIIYRVAFIPKQIIFILNKVLWKRQGTIQVRICFIISLATFFIFLIRWKLDNIVKSIKKHGYKNVISYSICQYLSVLIAWFIIHLYTCTSQLLDNKQRHNLLKLLDSGWIVDILVHGKILQMDNFV